MHIFFGLYYWSSKIDWYFWRLSLSVYIFYWKVRLLSVGGNRPFGRPTRPNYDDDNGDDIGDLFGNGGSSSTYRPSGGFGGGGSSSSGSGGSSSAQGSGDSSSFDDGSYKPSGEDGQYRPGSSSSSSSSTQRPSSSTTFINSEESDETNGSDIGSDEMFGTTTRPSTPRPGGRPTTGYRPTIRPGGTRPGSRPNQRPRPGRPNYDEDNFGNNDLSDDFGLFEGTPSTRPTSRPSGGGIHIGKCLEWYYCLPHEIKLVHSIICMK